MTIMEKSPKDQKKEKERSKFSYWSNTSLQGKSMTLYANPKWEKLEGAQNI